MRGSVLYWYRNHQSSCLVHSAEQLQLSLGEQRMNDMDSMSRESKKDQLRKRVISGENGKIPEMPETSEMPEMPVSPASGHRKRTAKKSSEKPIKR